MNLFEHVFRRQPTEKVDVIKGALSLRFILGDEDYETIHGLDKRGESSACMIVLSEVPMILMPRSQVTEDTLGHELEHVRNQILRRSRDELFFGADYDIFGTKFQNRYEDALLCEGEYRATDEILAYFGALDNLDLEIDPNMTDAYIEDTEKSLISESGIYFRKYFSKHKEEEQVRKYIQSVKRGIVSVKGLYDFYKIVDLDSAMRMAVNVMEQFPLRSWPAVLKLIKQKHRMVKI